MYVPPALLRLQKVISESNSPREIRKCSEPILDLEEKNEKKRDTLDDLINKYKSSESKTLVISSSLNKEEKILESNTNVINDFWYDIYNLEFQDIYSEKEQKLDKLVWANTISKQSMVKLLQEQGIIKFNPIEYYRNTIESQNQQRNIKLDDLYKNVYDTILRTINGKSIHSMTLDDIKKLVCDIEGIFDKLELEYSDKVVFLKEIKNELEETFKTKRTELLIKYGFKYNQYRDFINKFFIIVNDNDTKKKLLNDKLKQSILKNEKINVTQFDKFVKKEGKALGFLETKYIYKYIEITLTIHVLEEYFKTLNKKDKHILLDISNRLDVLRFKLEKVKILFDRIILPYKSLSDKEIIVSIEKELELYECQNLKEKIKNSREGELLQKNKKSDEQILTCIRNYDYSTPTVNDLSNFIQNIQIESNRELYMIEILKYFSDEILLTKPSIYFLVYIETYLYIIDCIDKNKDKLDTKLEKIYNSIKTKTEQYLTRHKKDLYEIQMRELYEHLEPLSKFDEKKPKLDKWQKEVFEMIDSKKNVIVIAPTSSGKTVLSTYCSIISNKLLFVVPSCELSRQVCGMIRNLILDNKLKKNVMLVTEKDIYSDTNKTYDILVGTPGALERYFVEKDVDTEIFDYVVFDEVHQLNNDIVGMELERFVKLLTSNSNTKFLALSACIGNTKELLEWWKQFVNEIELVVCDRRFLQQQKYIWNKKGLNKVNPLSVCNLEFLQKNGFIENNVAKVEMSMTPDDLYDIYKKMCVNDLFNLELHPNHFFKKNRLSLEDCKNWEWAIKLELQRLSKEDPIFIEKLLNEYQRDLDTIIYDGDIKDIYKLLKTLQKNNMLPTILFRLDDNSCQKLFTDLIFYLKEKEQETYPTYYDDLRIRNDAYLEMKEKEKLIDSMDLPDFKKLEEMNVTPQIFLEEKKNELRCKELSQLQKKVSNLMDSRIIETKEKLGNEKNQNLVKIYKKQLKYYESEKSKILKLEELNHINIYKPHPDYTFLDDYINSDHIIEYRKQLMEYMKEEQKDKVSDDYKETTLFDDTLRKDSYVSYEHPFIIGIERGIILYLNRLPTPFQRVAQSLIASPLKLAPVTFSDKSLAFGINYPIRSVILTGGYINPIIAHQMIGRAGRRGIDPKGYTIYYDVDWKTIHKEKYLEVNGSDYIDKSNWVIPYIWSNVSNKFDITFKYHLKDFMEHKVDLENEYDIFLEEVEFIWGLFKKEFLNELISEELFYKLLVDLYRNKRFGLQILFIPYLIEELSKWKFMYKEFDSSKKNDLIKEFIFFLNGELDNGCFTSNFKDKVSKWGKLKYSNKELTIFKLDDKVDEKNLNDWIIVLDFISSLYDIVKEHRIKKILKSIYDVMKLRIKKYTF